MARRNKYVQFAIKEAKRWGVPVGILLAQIAQESGFNPKAHSGAGAMGIGQFIQSTWDALVRRYGMQGKSPWDPYAAITVMSRYMGGLIKQYGNLEDPLSVYNSGQPWSRGQHIGQTNAYVHSILANAHRYGSSSFSGSSSSQSVTAGSGGGGAGTPPSPVSAPITGGSQNTLGPSASDQGAIQTAESSQPTILSPGAVPSSSSGPQRAPDSWQLLMSQPLVDAETQALYNRRQAAGG